MTRDVNTVKLLGVAQVLVFVSFLITESLQASAVGSGSITEILLSISKRLSLMRISGLAALGWEFCILSCFTKSTRLSRLWPWGVFC